MSLPRLYIQEYTHPIPQKQGGRPVLQNIMNWKERAGAELRKAPGAPTKADCPIMKFICTRACNTCTNTYIRVSHTKKMEIPKATAQVQEGEVRGSYHEAVPAASAPQNQ